MPLVDVGDEAVVDIISCDIESGLRERYLLRHACCQFAHGHRSTIYIYIQVGE